MNTLSLAPSLALIVDRWWRRALQAWQRATAARPARVEARATALLLATLDRRTLQDLGFARSEADSIAAGSAGLVAAERLRTARRPFTL